MASVSQVNLPLRVRELRDRLRIRVRSTDDLEADVECNYIGLKFRKPEFS